VTPAEPAPKSRRALLPAAALTLLALVLFPRAVFRGEAFYERDVHLVWHAQVEPFVRAVGSGAWPVWNPFLSFGQPMLANPHTQVLYPFTWLSLLLPPWILYTLFVLAHSLFAGMGLFFLAQRLGTSRGGAFVAAACWMASGPFLSLGNMWIQLGGASWIPWVWLAADRALETRAAVHAVVWGGAVALQLFAGSPDMSLLTVAALAAWTLWSVRPRTQGERLEWGGLATAAMATAFAIALSAALWLPALDLTRKSARWSLDSAHRAVWSVHPFGLAEAFSPVPLTDLPIGAALRGWLYDGGVPLIHGLYLGVPMLALVAAALGGVAPRARAIAVAVLAAATVFALGHHTPVSETAVALLPPLRVLRYPSKAMVLVALAWALLAGVGFDRWRAPEALSRRRWLWIVVGPLLAVTTAGAVLAVLLRWRPDLFGPLLLPEPALSSTWAEALAPASLRLACTAGLGGAAVVAAVMRSGRPQAAKPLARVVAGLVLLDLALAGMRLNPTVPVDFYKLRPPILGAVHQDDLSRLFVYRYPFLATASGGPDDPYRIARYPPEMSFDAGRTLGARLYLTPPVGGCWGLFGSYEPDLIGLYPAPLATLVRWMEQAEGTPAYARFLRLGAVKHVSALRRHGGFETLQAVGAYPSLLARPILLLEVPNPLPRTYAVGTARPGDGEAARLILIDPRFDPSREVVLPDNALEGGPGFSGTSRILDFRADRVRLEAELSQPGVVVLVDTYDPGWRVTVDGRPAPLLRVNMAFRGVKVPAGRHVIEQVYRPWTLVYGLAASAMAALAAAAVVLSRGRRWPRARQGVGDARGMRPLQ
jgi:hypothetical protein